MNRSFLPGRMADRLSGAAPVRRKELFLTACCVVTAAIFLAICSKSSFLYPLNDWGDANCYLTVGRSLLRGRVLYRDIYDQKGPLLYLLHSAASLISPNGFFGVYLLETAFFAWFLRITARLARLFQPERTVYLLLPLVSALLLSSPAFCHGDSAEEFCLPFVAFSLYTLVQHFKQENRADMPLRLVLLNGIGAGCVLTIKFSLAGFHLAWILTVLVVCVAGKRYKRAASSLLTFAAGVLLPIAPWLLYFLLNNALRDFYTGYIINNVFLYSKVPGLPLSGHLFSRLSNAGTALLQNYQYSVFIVLGLASILFTKRFRKAVPGRLGLALGFLLLTAGAYAGDVAYGYYALILGALAPAGLIAVFCFAGARMKAGSVRKTVLGLVAVAVFGTSLAFSWARSPNTYLLGTPRSAMAQYSFRDIILKSENPTLLNYGFLDFGEYTVCGIVPTCKYFCGLNLALPEIRETQDDVIRSRQVEFVVTRGAPPPLVLSRYGIAAQQAQFFEGRTVTYYLLQRLAITATEAGFIASSGSPRP